MRKTDLADIRAVLAKVRVERFPDLPQELVDAVLDVEAASSEDDAAALRGIRAAVVGLADRR
jgi:hypothetical protein